MGATLVKTYKVYKIHAGVAGGDLFGDSETVVVMSEHAEKNCFPHHYKWSFDFIGDVQSFQDLYLPKSAYFYDDGLTQSPQLDSGKAFVSHLKSLYENAKLFALQDLHDVDWFGYSWDESVVHRIENTSNLKKFTFWLGTRYAGRLDNQDDVERMVREACHIVPSESEHVWMGQLWSLDLKQVERIGKALDDTDFRMAI